MKPMNAPPQELPRPHRRATQLARLAGLVVCVAALQMGEPAVAQEFQLNLEPAVAVWLDDPQSDHFTPGFYGAVRPGVSLGPIFTLQWSYALLATPAGQGFTELGTGNYLTTGLRVRPFGATRDPEDQLGGLSVDANIGYVRTEDLDRLGYDVGVGYTFQATPSFAIGPIVRYHQIVQPDQLANRDPNDAQLLTIGLNLGFSPKYTEEPELTCPDAPECVQETPVVAAVPTPCADRDKDGTCDDVDRCPTQMGPVASFGCPIDPCSGKPLVVSVQFDYDSARLPLPKDGPESMDPVLDAVAAAISRDPSCRVCISGYASEEGTDPYNLKLSRKRASAVQSYMVARGLTEARLPSIGMGEGCQLMPEESRELNRRVEFLALEGDETCPTACAE